jgi:hypothetical protein
MVCHQRFQSPADGVLPKGENNEQEIQGDQFNHEIPNGLTNEEKEKEQKHPRVGSEEKKETEHRPIALPVTVLKCLRHIIGKNPPRDLFQTRETRAQYLLFADITKMELEQ